jgi:UDP-3-O-acyl-N-acetylglucosamine deacetylase
VVAECAGHALHAELVRALLKDHAAWSIETAAPHAAGFEYAVAQA